MTYSITTDFMNHGYSEDVAKKVDFLLNGLITCPGIFEFNKDEREIVKMYSSGFADLEGIIEVEEDKDLDIDFTFREINDKVSRYRYKDGKIRYAVSNMNGLYVLKGNAYEENYEVSYYCVEARNYILHKYNLYDNMKELLRKPKKLFKQEAILPDFKYCLTLTPDSLTETPSSYIFGNQWRNNCQDYMEGESYEPFNPKKANNMKLEKKRKGKKHQQ